MAFCAISPTIFLVLVFLSIVIEEEIVAGGLVTTAVRGAYSLFSVPIEEENTALSAVTPITLAGAGRIIIGDLVLGKVTFLTHMRALTRHPISSTTTFVLRIAIEEQHVAIDAMCPVILRGCCERESYSRAKDYSRRADTEKACRAPQKRASANVLAARPIGEIVQVS